MGYIDLHYKPKLRPVDAFPAEIEGKSRLVIRDPAKIAEEVLVLSLPSQYLLSLMDGSHTVLEIQHFFERQFNLKVPAEQLVRFVEKLDRFGFLESELLEERIKKIASAYEARRTRPPICAGSAYPDQPEELKDFLNTLIPSNHAIGLLPAGVISPHIDYPRGRKVYASLWSRLRHAPPPDAVVILGTSHYDGEHMLSLSTKPYQTPLGISPIQRELAASLQEEVGSWITEGSFAHWNEHSVELQVVLIQHLFGELPIVPLLCGPIEIFSSKQPLFSETIERLRRWYRKVSARYRLLCIAGADLSHVGNMFGDQGTLSQQLLAWIEKEDRESLQLVVEGKSQEVMNQILHTQDLRKVCGLAPIYFLLEMLAPCSGMLIDYDQWVDPAGRNTVTFGAALLYSRERQAST